MNIVLIHYEVKFLGVDGGNGKGFNLVEILEQSLE